MDEGVGAGSGEELAVLLRRAGLAPGAEQLAVLQEGWALVQPMLKRLREPERGREAEPAVLFRADPLP